jgi:hypothetical protein
VPSSEPDSDAAGCLEAPPAPLHSRVADRSQGEREEGPIGDQEAEVDPERLARRVLTVRAPFGHDLVGRILASDQLERDHPRPAGTGHPILGQFAYDSERWSKAHDRDVATACFIGFRDQVGPAQDQEVVFHLGAGQAERSG